MYQCCKYLPDPSRSPDDQKIRSVQISSRWPIKELANIHIQHSNAWFYMRATMAILMGAKSTLDQYISYGSEKQGMLQCSTVRMGFTNIPFSFHFFFHFCLESLI